VVLNPVRSRRASDEITSLLKRFPVVAILGARQVGKSTLSRLVARGARSATFFDLENPVDLARLAEPSFALGGLRGLVVLDEIQRRPELFPVLRVLADRPRSPARFLLLGSASPELLRQSSESLAGRIAYVELDGFDASEVKPSELDRLWLRGGFPKSFLARTDAESFQWRTELVRTYLERDIPQLGIRVPSASLGRLYAMLAHWHGQLWNGAELGRSLGVSDTTVRSWLDVLAGTFAVRVLQPFHENLAKRQVKSPRVYIADPGILHALLDIRNRRDLDGHPKVGASWEGFVVRQIVGRLGASWRDCYFWRTHEGAELDLLVVRGRQRLGFEVKRTDAPSMTPSMRHALADLGLTSLTVVHAGRERFELAKGVHAVPLVELVRPRAARPMEPRTRPQGGPRGTTKFR